MTYEIMRKYLEGLVIHQAVIKRGLEYNSTTAAYVDKSREELCAAVVKALSGTTTATLTPLVRQLINEHRIFPVITSSAVYWQSVAAFENFVNEYACYGDATAITIAVLLTNIGLVCTSDGCKSAGFSKLLQDVSKGSTIKATCYTLQEAFRCSSYGPFDELAKELAATTVKFIPTWLDYESFLRLVQSEEPTTVDCYEDGAAFSEILKGVDSCSVLTRDAVFSLGQIFDALDRCYWSREKFVDELFK